METIAIDVKAGNLSFVFPSQTDPLHHVRPMPFVQPPHYHQHHNCQTQRKKPTNTLSKWLKKHQLRRQNCLRGRDTLFPMQKRMDNTATSAFHQLRRFFLLQNNQKVEKKTNRIYLMSLIILITTISSQFLTTGVANECLAYCASVWQLSAPNPSLKEGRTMYRVLYGISEKSVRGWKD